MQGCFWHGHTCQIASKPKSNADYWRSKIEKNRRRDAKNFSALTETGWEVLELWECEIRKSDGLVEKIESFMHHET